LDYATPQDKPAAVSWVDVNEVVQSTQALVRHMRKTHHFDLRIRLGVVDPVRISPSELQQVLVNLVVNGVYAVEETGGLIEIETGVWPGKGVVIRVRDNGSGMDEETLEKIFNPFYSQRREGRGTGLGLAISHGLIQRYGGRITVESQPGEGSCFSVWLPREAIPNTHPEDDGIADAAAGVAPTGQRLHRH